MKQQRLAILKRTILSPISPVERKFVTLITLGMLLTSAVTYVVRNRALVSSDGSAWLHGEWLINYGAGFVRRGASGSFAIIVADMTGLSPLIIVEILQSCAVIFIIGAVLLALWKIGLPPLVLILSISPAFVVFWLNNYGVPTKDIHGKEMLGYLALLPMLYAASARTFMVPGLALSGVIYVIAVLFYEPNILFAVPLLLSAYIVQSAHDTPGVFPAYAISLLLTGAALALLTVRFPEVSDTEAMCVEMTQRGVDRSICNKFGWSSETLQHALSFTSSRTEMRSIPRMLLAICFSFLPVLILFAKLRSNRALYLAIVLQAVAFMPLYFVGIDYGRWLNIQISSIILLLFIALLAGKFAELCQPSSRVVVWPLLVLALAWGLQPVYGGVEIGAVKYVAKLFDASL